MFFAPPAESQLRHSIDALSVIQSWRRAKDEAKAVRGSMFWRELRCKATLIRVATSGAQTVIGKDTPENRDKFERFLQRKEAANQRVKRLPAALERR